MLAGIRQIAYGLAMVMAGFLVVALAYSIWAALFRTDARILFGIEKPPLCMFDCESPWWVSAYVFGYYVFGYYDALIGVGVVIWLIGYAIRRVTKSLSSGHPA
jgi:hypothetical protein